MDSMQIKMKANSKNVWITVNNVTIKTLVMIVEIIFTIKMKKNV